MSRILGTLFGLVAALGLISVVNPSPASAAWAGRYIDWRGSGDGNRDNLRYKCGANGDAVLMAKGTTRNLCASTPSRVTVYLWIPAGYNIDRWTIAGGWRKAAGPGAKWITFPDAPRGWTDIMKYQPNV